MRPMLARLNLRGDGCLRRPFTGTGFTCPLNTPRIRTWHTLWRRPIRTPAFRTPLRLYSRRPLMAAPQALN